MGGKKKNSIKFPLNQKSCGEYDLRQSFSKLNQYRTSNVYQTDTNNERNEESFTINNNLPQHQYYNSNGETIGDKYFRLEDKISELSDKYDNAHNDLRKELERKIDTLRGEFDHHCQGHRDNIKWIIGIVVAIIGSILGYILLPYKQANSIHEDVVKIQTTINENIKPSIEKNEKNIEQNAKDIKGNTEKIYQLQGQSQNKRR